MKRYLLGLVLILFAFESKSQIATYDFTGTLGSQISQPPTSVIANVTATDITRGSGINPNAGANSINSRDWEPTFDANDYYEFIITPSANYTINLTNLSIQFQKSATGPNNYEIRTKVGANAEVTQGTGTFGTAGTASVGVISTSPVLGVVPSSTAVRFRIYAYGSSNTTGTLRLTSPLTLSGTAPLPITLISFNAALSESNQTTLKWATAKEFDNSYFEISTCTELV